MTKTETRFVTRQQTAAICNNPDCRNFGRRLSPKKQKLPCAICGDTVLRVPIWSMLECGECGECEYSGKKPSENKVQDTKNSSCRYCGSRKTLTRIFELEASMNNDGRQPSPKPADKKPNGERREGSQGKNSATSRARRIWKEKRESKKDGQINPGRNTDPSTTVRYCQKCGEKIAEHTLMTRPDTLFCGKHIDMNVTLLPTQDVIGTRRDFEEDSKNNKSEARRPKNL